MRLFPLLYMLYFSKIFNSSKDRRRLNDGNRIPPIGFGTGIELEDLDVAEQAVIQAIESGYRLIDTAALYGTEPAIGRAIANVTRRRIVKREDLFISTKLNVTVTTREGVVPALKDALHRLQTTYVDLFLIHVPYNVFNAKRFSILSIWKGLEDAKNLGLAKSIGVSNFNSTQINEILTYSEIRPAVNEIEVSLTFANMELVAYCQSEDILVISYSPLGYLVPRPLLVNTNVGPLFKDPMLSNIAKKYNKSDIQIDLRYLIERNTVPIPRSVTLEHIKENIDVFDFTLTKEEVYLIKNMDQNENIFNVDEEGASILFRGFYNATDGLQT